MKYYRRELARRLRNMVGGSLPSSMRVAAAIDRDGGRHAVVEAARTAGYMVALHHNPVWVCGHYDGYTDLYIGGVKGWVLYSSGAPEFSEVVSLPDGVEYVVHP